MSKRGPNKIPKKGNTSKRLLRRRRIEEASARSKYHELEWIDFQHGICVNCGIKMHLIEHTAKGKAGWQMKDVWGGNDYGIGGALTEPPCRSVDR